jgi:hypothetical protein
LLTLTEDADDDGVSLPALPIESPDPVDKSAEFDLEREVVLLKTDEARPQIGIVARERHQLGFADGMSGGGLVVTSVTAPPR